MSEQKQHDLSTREGCFEAFLEQKRRAATISMDFAVRLGRCRRALHAADLHGHYTIFQAFFGEDADKGDTLEAENAALKSTVASLLSIDDSKVAEYVVLSPESLREAAGNRVAELEAKVQQIESDRDLALVKSSRGVWRCFHCDEVFDTPGGARDHFGASQGETPGCVLKVQLGDERGWLMALRKAQESDEQQLERALAAEREVERLECRVASLSSDMKFIKPFAKCDSMRDVFNVYDSMEGRALAAEERATNAEAKVARLEAPVSDAERHALFYSGGEWMGFNKEIDALISARSTPPAKEAAE